MLLGSQFIDAIGIALMEDMERLKQLLSFQRRSLILHAVEVALASLCQHVEKFV
ncbi:MAG: hypothetical protein RMY36_017690 [Nostoc sp. SerVER01]|nr:hypothetical protein [Nostoc sp. DcaGUA01]